MITATAPENLAEVKAALADLPATYDLRDVARLASISVRTAGRLAARGLIPGRIANTNRLIRFSREKITAWLRGE